ncbi:MAG: hypothetical protein Q4D06_00930 [Coriobacteriia bacterium]|nr:hypothetical protein [Coriobacteriia bacterium]
MLHPDQTPPEFALSLCDVLPAAAATPQVVADIADRALAESGAGSFRRLYVGSYFCDRLFLTQVPAQAQAAADFADQYGLQLTLVLPICSQHLLEPVKQLTRQLLDAHPAIDELVANDPAMLRFAADLAEAAPRPLRLATGRLLARSQRDPRYFELEAGPQPFALDDEAAFRLENLTRCRISRVEVDPFAPVVSTWRLTQTPLALHLPHAVMTTGHICAPASSDLPPERKFRPDGPCQHQCLQRITVHQAANDRGQDVFLTRQGRTVFFENPACVIDGPQPQRIIWTPADFLCSEGGSPWDQF